MPSMDACVACGMVAVLYTYMHDVNETKYSRHLRKQRTAHALKSKTMNFHENRLVEASGKAFVDHTNAAAKARDWENFIECGDGDDGNGSILRKRGSNREARDGKRNVFNAERALNLHNKISLDDVSLYTRIFVILLGVYWLFRLPAHPTNKETPQSGLFWN